ncbi:crotonase/enoyl-CoA hydratase family protein [Erythrobacter sp. GH1-10]|uniref:crotonase/enoyl-CoA hydratase family protein n=1 Tax=Erythrobacter sp. GH1-10 TaxID=3349334 RepID=UPI0038782C3C
MITNASQDGAHIITLDDGKVNALNKDKLDALVAALAECATDQAPVAIRGRKGIFSAGFDLKGFAAGPDVATAQLQAGKDAILAILRHPAPVVTVCEGHAYPGGAFLMLAADHAIGVDGDFVVGMNESAIGMVLPLYATTLGMARLAPAGRKAIATGELFNSRRGMEVGYFDRVVAPDALDATVDHVLTHMKSLNAGAFGGNKQIINAQLVKDVEAAPLPDLG